jgi:DNA-binding LacI/PurR family transcriptional regulator
MASTLRDVANRAGVSVATASRVAAGAPGVRPATRERVELAMRELLYVARGTTSTGIVGLLVPELDNPIFPALAQAMEHRAADAGYATILCNTAGSAQREAEYVHMLVERRVDGMIFISSEVTDLRSDHSHYVRLREEGARLVFVNGSAESLDVTSVGVDERAAGKLATEHLLGLGHRRIGFAAGDRDSMPTREKAEGRLQALRAANVEAEGLVSYTAFSVEGGRRALRELLAARGGPPTGVVCSSDLMAIGVMMEASEQGLVVPDDLSVVGFDGIEAAAWTRPGLTTIEQPIADIAETAVGALRSLIDEPERPLPDFVFRPKLRQRASTSPPRESA